MASIMPDIGSPQLNFGESDESASVALREVPWETYMTARLISDRELQLIRRYDKKDPATQKGLLTECGPAVVDAFFTVLRNVTKEDTVQYVLATLDAMIKADSGAATLFHQGVAASDPYSVFLRLLQRQDWFSQHKACLLLAHMIAARPGRAGGGDLGNLAAGGAGTSQAPPAAALVEATLVNFLEWLCGQLRRPTDPARSVPCAVSALAVLLVERPVRMLFVQLGGVPLVAALLKVTQPPNIQLLYEASLVCWLLSFVPEGLEAMSPTKVVAGLVEVARGVPKEKVVRAAVLALKNLLAAEGGNAALSFGSDMVEAGLPKAVATLKLRAHSDEDLIEALEWLEEGLANSVLLMSSFEKYRKEVLSGTLDWSPVHTERKFWAANYAEFEDRDFQVLRILLKLLETSREPRTLAVACHDVGMFTAAHPHGRHIVSQLGGKAQVMKMMAHPEADVQKQALMAVQKIMITKDKLEFLTGAGPGGGGAAGMLRA